MDKQVLGENCVFQTMPKFIVAHWLVEPSINQLTHVDTQEQRSLEPRLMHLLCLLASEPGSVQTRETLIETIWPKVIVNENSLTRAVSELRKKLSHPSDPQCLIATIPKVGYRLTAPCKVYVDAVRQRLDTQQEAIAEPAMVNNGAWQAAVHKLSTSRQSLAASAFALVALVVFSAFNLTIDRESAIGTQQPLADINISGADALDSLIHARINTVAATDNAVQLGVSNSEGSQPVISRDGRLFAQIRYSDEGSSLLLGSTDLPSSPVTVLSTQDVLYNLQWSPIDRALLFAQSPRITNAALLGQEQASLVMFDIDSFSTRVIQGPATPTQEENKQTKPHGFKLTSLGKHLGWLS